MRMNGASHMWVRPGSKHAAVRVEVPGLIARMTIEMTFPAQAGSNRADWAEVACGKVLIVLDPA
jgi:hypothetical protein